MHVHGTCVARDTDGVLLVGPPGCGKSDLALRLIDRGFMLVADDQVVITDSIATPPPSIAGLLEVRGLGLLHIPHVPHAAIRLVLDLDPALPPARLPAPLHHAALGVPLIRLSAHGASAAQRVALALDCVTGRVRLEAGAFPDAWVA